MSNLSEKDLALLNNQRQRKKTINFSILAIVFAALLFLGGCGMLNMFTESYEDIRDEMLQHLYEKYGVEFIATSLERGSHDFLAAHPIGGDPIADFVGVQRHVRNDGVEFRDTFFGILIRDNLEAGITAALADIGLPFKVFFPSDFLVFNNKFDGTKDFADFNAWVAEGNPFRLSLTIFLGVESMEHLDTYANRAFEKIQETGYSLGVVLNFTPIAVFEQIERTNRTNILGLYRRDITSIINDSIN